MRQGLTEQVAEQGASKNLPDRAENLLERFLAFVEARSGQVHDQQEAQGGKAAAAKDATMARRARLKPYTSERRSPIT